MVKQNKTPLSIVKKLILKTTTEESIGIIYLCFHDGKLGDHSLCWIQGSKQNRLWGLRCHLCLTEDPPFQIPRAEKHLPSAAVPGMHHSSLGMVPSISHGSRWHQILHLSPHRLAVLENSPPPILPITSCAAEATPFKLKAMERNWNRTCDPCHLIFMNGREYSDTKITYLILAHPVCWPPSSTALSLFPPPSVGQSNFCRIHFLWKVHKVRVSDYFRSTWTKMLILKSTPAWKDRFSYFISLNFYKFSRASLFFFL